MQVNMMELVLLLCLVGLAAGLLIAGLCRDAGRRITRAVVWALAASALIQCIFVLVPFLIQGVATTNSRLLLQESYQYNMLGEFGWMVAMWSVGLGYVLFLPLAVCCSTFSLIARNWRVLLYALATQLPCVVFLIFDERLWVWLKD